MPIRPPHRPLRADFPHKVPRYPVRFRCLLAVRTTRQLTKPTGASLNYPSFVVGLALRQLVGSASFLSFRPTHAIPGLAFPPVGRLGLTSPPSLVLRSATTATRPSRCPLLVARPPIPCSFLTFVSSLTFKLVAAQEPLPQRPACLVSRYAISGLPTRKQVALPSSQATPLSACPALRPRWCPEHSPYRTQDCCFPLA